MSVDISTYFEKYEWTAERADTNVWLSTFATDREEDFDLYVASANDWLHFAISPSAAPAFRSVRRCSTRRCWN
ncbi:MAG: hypothetical protein R2873_12585 [Caldilineaceae bacterium]